MNIELITEDVSFPLNFDGYSYIWDSKNNMIAMFVSDEKKQIADEIIYKLNDFAQKQFHFDNSGYSFQKQGNDLILKEGKPFILIRGWGRLQYKENAVQRHENVLDMFLEALNVA